MTAPLIIEEAMVTGVVRFELHIPQSKRGGASPGGVLNSDNLPRLAGPGEIVKKDQLAAATADPRQRALIERAIALIPRGRALLGDVRVAYGVAALRAQGIPPFYHQQKVLPDGSRLQAIINGDQEIVKIFPAIDPQPRLRWKKKVVETPILYTLWVHDGADNVVEYDTGGQATGKRWPVGSPLTATNLFADDMICAFGAVWLVTINNDNSLPNAVPTLHRIDTKTGAARHVDLPQIAWTFAIDWNSRVSFQASETHVYVGHGTETVYGSGNTLVGYIHKFNGKTGAVEGVAEVHDGRADMGMVIKSFVLLYDDRRLYAYWGGHWMNANDNDTTESQGVDCTVIDPATMAVSMRPKATWIREIYVFGLDREKATGHAALGTWAGWDNAIIGEHTTPLENDGNSWTLTATYGTEFTSLEWTLRVPRMHFVSCDGITVHVFGAPDYTVQVPLFTRTVTTNLPLARRGQYDYDVVDHAIWDTEDTIWMAVRTVYDYWIVPRYSVKAQLLRLDLNGNVTAFGLPDRSRGLAIEFHAAKTVTEKWEQVEDDEPDDQPEDYPRPPTLEELASKAIGSRSFPHSTYV